MAPAPAPTVVLVAVVMMAGVEVSEDKEEEALLMVAEDVAPEDSVCTYPPFCGAEGGSIADVELTTILWSSLDDQHLLSIPKDPQE